jgi:phage terminase large subunit GpA-like protein
VEAEAQTLQQEVLTEHQPLARQEFQKVWERYRTRFRTRKAETYCEFAGRIVLPDGKEKNNHYKPATHQVQLEILRLADAGWKRITIAKPVQDGGTLVALTILFQRAVTRNQSVVIAFPTQESSEDIWKTKALPILRAFGGIMPTTGGGSEGGASRVIVLPGGGMFVLRTAGGRGESQQASITMDAIQVEEFDDWPSIDRTRAIAARIEESPEPLVLEISTVKKCPSILLKAYDAGTQTRLHYQCPECGRFQALEWEQVRWTEVDGRLQLGSEHYLCSVNGCAIAVKDRRLLLANYRVVHAGQVISPDGVVSGEPKDRKHLSILWTRLESPRKTLESTVETFLEARRYLEETGDHDLMSRFMRDQMCREYRGEADELDLGAPLKASDLASKSLQSSWPAVSEYRHEMEKVGGTMVGLYARHLAVDPDTHAVVTPGDAEATFMGVDVQHNRCYWVLVAANQRRQEWDCHWGMEYANYQQKPASRDEFYAMFDRIADLAPRISGELPFLLGGIDCGDVMADIVRQWVASHALHWRAVRGDTHSHKVEEWDIDGISYVRDHVIYMNVDNLGDSLQAAFRRPEDEPGSIIFPKGVTTTQSVYFKHLVAKQSSLDPKTKKRIWIRGSGREDWRDARLYVRGLIIGWAAQEMQSKKQAALAAKTQAAVQQQVVRQQAQAIDDEDLPQRPMRGTRPMSSRGNPGRNLIGRNRQWRH